MKRVILLVVLLFVLGSGVVLAGQGDEVFVSGTVCRSLFYTCKWGLGTPIEGAVIRWISFSDLSEVYAASGPGGYYEIVLPRDGEWEATVVHGLPPDIICPVFRHTFTSGIDEEHDFVCYKPWYNYLPVLFGDAQ